MPDSSPRNEDTDPNKPHRDIARWTKAVAAFTFLLFIVSAVSDLFIWKQYKLANETQKDTREQLKAVVTQVGVQGFVLWGGKPDVKLNGITFVTRFQNTGGTRTAWVRGWMSVHYFDGADPPNNLDLNKPYEAVETSDTIVGANSPLDISATIPAVEAERLLERQGTALVWGLVEYADIFEPTKAHHIGFCIKIIPSDTKVIGPDMQPPKGIPYRPDCNHHD